MKSYWMRMQGEQATLELRDLPAPEPGPRQIRLRVRAAALNRGEFIAGHGLHASGGAAKAIGMEAAGVVEACGAEVVALRVGDRVMGRCPGAFAELALMDEREALPVPEALAWEAAAAIPLTFLVVHDMLLAQGRLQAGQWLLVAGVSSGVGVAALQTGRALGARVIGTSGSPAKLARLKTLGLDLGLPTPDADFHAAVMQATGGQGVNLVVNAVGGSVFEACLAVLGFEGRLATVGYVDGVLQAPLDLEALHAKRLTLFGVSNKLRTPAQRAAGLADFKARVLPLIDAGRIAPVVDRVFAFDELAQAHAHMQANRHLGKIVLAGSAN